MQKRKEGDLCYLASWREREYGGFEGNMTVEYTFDDIQPGIEASIACHVHDDLSGEGLKAMKLKVE